MASGWVSQLCRPCLFLAVGICRPRFYRRLHIYTQMASVLQCLQRRIVIIISSHDLIGFLQQKKEHHSVSVKGHPRRA